MNSLILTTAARVLKYLLMPLSVLVLLRGHHNPGGGFAGGLLAAAAFAFEAIDRRPQAARRSFQIDPHYVIAVGLLSAIGSGVMGMLAGWPFLTGLWVMNVGTPLLFDLGVYLVVMGVALLILFTLAEE